MPADLLPLIAVLGPTGAGKSELSLRIAEEFRGEIVNCDSVQVYCGLNIGSAKLSPPERRGVAHHVLDIVGPGHDFTAGEYLRSGRLALREISGRHRLPIVVGGTGFYLRALLLGLSPAPLRDEAIRDRLRRIANRRPQALHRLLERADIEASRRIHANDHQKLIRALEMSLLAHQKVSQVQSRPRDALQGYSVLKIGLSPERKALYKKIDARCVWMFENGIIEETRLLLEQGYQPQSKALQTLGYRQAVQILDNSLSIQQAITDCQTKTRQYAKRQMTWFRGETDIKWHHGFGTDRFLQQAVFEDVKAHLLSCYATPLSESEQHQ